MQFITSLFKRAPTAESLWNEMIVSKNADESAVLERVKEFVKADPMNLYKFIDGPNGQHTLLTASLKSQMKPVTVFLLTQKADPNFFANFKGAQYPIDPEKLLPLRLAIENHWFDVAKMMAQTADTSLSTRTSLLALAIQQGADAELVDMLAAKGTPAELSLLISQEYSLNFISQAKAAQLLFNKFKHDLNGETPLHQAAKKASVNMMQMLIRSGHPLNLVNGNEGTPLQATVAKGLEDSIVMLVEAKADPNTPATNGNRPLHVTKNPQIIQYLIENGADPFVANNSGTVPFLQMLEDSQKGTHNYGSSFETIFTAINKELLIVEPKLAKFSRLPTNSAAVVHAKQVLSRESAYAFSDVLSSLGEPQPRHPLVNALHKAAIVLNACIVEKKQLNSPKLEQLVDKMSNIVTSLLMDEQFKLIVDKAKNTPQASELAKTLTTLNNVAKAESMTRVQKSIAVHQSTLSL